MKEIKVKEEAAVEAATETESLNVTKEGREERLEKLSRHHILASMGVGLVPVPMVDVVALMGVQLNMIRKLAAEYDIPFKQDRGKSIITSLVGGLLSTELGIAICSLIKCIPVIGQTIGAVAMPVMSGAATYAIYKVFVQHFESGGTFLDLDPAKVKSYFTEQFRKGKKVVTDLRSDETAKAAA
jgi:uncharacterized protein (DUF697 family)